MQNRLKEYRVRAGLSQAELARRTHTASPNLSAVEHGTRSAWPILKRRLARALTKALKTEITEDQLFPEGQ